MHEVGIARDVIDIVERTAKDSGLRAVSSVVLEIGKLSGVEPEALRFAFELIRQGTVLEHAQISIEEPPLLLYCTQCDREYSAEVYDPLCPVCGGASYEVRQGMDMLVKSISGE